MKIRLNYIGHSGFLCETEEQYLLFDYFEGRIPPMTGTKPIFVFVSHAHYDHFNEAIFQLSEQYGRSRVQYVLSSDIGEIEDILERLGDRIIFMKPHETRVIACGGDAASSKVGRANTCGSVPLTIETLRSNDAGVAWLLSMGGKRIYHAGDLQLWDWPGEPEADNLHYKETFETEIDVLNGYLGENGTKNGIDLAMLVLDERQEQSAFLGIDYFLSHIRTHYAVPMHSFGHYALYPAYQEHFTELQESGRIPASSVYLPISHADQTFELSI